MSQITQNFGTAVPTTFITDAGNAVPVLNTITIAGGNNIGTTGAGATVTINLDGTTNHALQLGNAAGSLTSLGVATNGQIPIGSVGADPVLATLTAGNNIAVTNTPGAIAIAVTGTTNHTIQIGNVAGSLTSLGAATNGQIPIGSTGADPVLATITAGSGIAITNAAGSISIATVGGGIVWKAITVNQTAVVNEGYICNKAGVLAVALPAASAVGDTFRVTGMNTDLGWSVTQAAAQQIHFGAVSSTIGVGGSLASTLKRDSIELVCCVAGLEWNVVSSVGNITVV
jgi:hypothetical protein